MKQPCQVWIYIFLLCRSAQLLLHATWQNMIMPIARMVVAPARCWCLVLQLPSLRADVLPPPGPPIVAWTCAFAAFHMPIQFVIHFFCLYAWLIVVLTRHRFQARPPQHSTAGISCASMWQESDNSIAPIDKLRRKGWNHFRNGHSQSNWIMK